MDDVTGPIPTVRTNLNLNVRGMGPSATVAINERSDELRRSGRRIFKLGLGQSPFPVAPPVVEALRRHAHQKAYLPVQGLPELREAVAAYHSRDPEVTASSDGVLVGPGSKELMFLLQLVYYGDLVIPTPAWVSYAPQAAIIGRRVEWIHTTADAGWKLRVEQLEALCALDPTRPRILVLNYPSNPTGGTYTEDELRAIAEVAQRYRVVLLSDEIYGELHHRGEHRSIARFYPQGTIISSGLSKWCGAGGWRLGTFSFPDSLAWLREAMAAVASETYTSTSAPIQYAAVTAFSGGPEIEEYLRRARRVLAALGTWSAGRLRRAGVHVIDPVGAFYLYPDLGAHRGALASRGVHDSATLCERLLEDTGVAVLPGSHFGAPPSELTLRLAYVDFDGQGALDAAAAVDDDVALPETWLRDVCGEVLEAVDRLAGWIDDRPGP